MKLDRTTTMIALSVGALCTIAGMWQALWGSLVLGAALVLVGVVITGLVWKHLLDVYRDQKQG